MPNMSRVIVVDPSSESAWECNRCRHVFPKGLDMCPQCTSVSVTEVRMPKVRVGQVEAEQEAEAARLAAGVPEGSSETETGSVDNPSGDSPYEGWVKRELQAELEKRGLAKSGNLTDLQDRLAEDDRAKAEAQSAKQEDIKLEAHGTVTPPPSE